MKSRTLWCSGRRWEYRFDLSAVGSGEFDVARLNTLEDCDAEIALNPVDFIWVFAFDPAGEFEGDRRGSDLGDAGRGGAVFEDVGVGVSDLVEDLDGGFG